MSYELNLSKELQIDLSEDILHIPIPDQSDAIAARELGYDDIPVDANHPLYANPLVPMSDYGIKSQSYYSRRNVTGDPIPGVSPDVLVRQDSAERLALVNTFLRNTQWVKDFCEGDVELLVEEGLRSKGLQTYVSKVRYPEFLRKKLERVEGESDEAFEARVQDGAAKSVSKAVTPPHSTGGVVDVKLIRADGNNKRVSYGFDHARRETVRTDFFEHNNDSTDAERSAQVRRLVYHTLAAVGGVVNPLEPWHFGFVDLNDPTRVSDGLTARSTGATHRFYDSVPGMPDADQSLQDQLNSL